LVYYSSHNNKLDKTTLIESNTNGRNTINCDQMGSEKCYTKNERNVAKKELA
jgi:hypothetical protein